MSAASTERKALPAKARLVFSVTEIEQIIARMAAEIESELGDADPILMPILIGGAFTAVKLAEHFRFDYEVDSVRLARYGRARTGADLHWYARPCLELDGRHVLLIDDVLDRGITLHAVERELRRMNAASVSAAVLIRKTLDSSVERPAVEFVGADAPDQFLFGCGMDLDGRWRGLPELYALESD